MPIVLVYLATNLFSQYRLMMQLCGVRRGQTSVHAYLADLCIAHRDDLEAQGGLARGVRHAGGNGRERKSAKRKTQTRRFVVAECFTSVDIAKEVDLRVAGRASNLERVVVHSWTGAGKAEAKRAGHVRRRGHLHEAHQRLGVALVITVLVTTE
jgi:hypothetical protein